MTLDRNIENEHLDDVCGMCLFFRIIMWLLVYMRITVFYYSMMELQSKQNNSIYFAKLAVTRYFNCVFL